MDISLVEFQVRFYWMGLVTPGFVSAHPLYLLMTTVYIYCLLCLKVYFLIKVIYNLSILSTI